MNAALVEVQACLQQQVQKTIRENEQVGFGRFNELMSSCMPFRQESMLRESVGFGRMHEKGEEIELVLC